MHHPFRMLMGSGLVLLELACAHAQNLLTNGTMEGTYASGIAPGWESARIDTRATSVLSESAAGRSGKAQLIEVTERLGGYDGWSGPSFATPDQRRQRNLSRSRLRSLGMGAVRAA